MRPANCIMCDRPIPRRRWWQLIDPPPWCQPQDPDCVRLFTQHLRGDWSEQHPTETTP